MMMQRKFKNCIYIIELGFKEEKKVINLYVLEKEF